ncbi:fasciclin domain-containing protein [Methanocella arvoryzae]|uniref:FAS1 domain-containing protein n=1 Tax=Methanocella arvoryzae (strain DSM 22066 / NBRC 105507 / MRE50) TaxID=351160 RepID=Q0W8K6_METAR|nr:fasciclin domain-containing protein [Methanocella arvoryzae]CAH04824.1 hypothetical protein similar to aldehyde dehydrogenase [uncultured archaeon]CAJ35287.1 hypothetical protein LRC313 [Methanocella arvoryzae MRE50]
MVGIRKIVVILALAAILAALSAPAAAQGAAMQTTQQSKMQMETSGKNVIDTLSGMPDVSMAASMLKSSEKEMKWAGSLHTLFIPTDAALSKMGMDQDRLNKVMSDRVVAGRAMQGFMSLGEVKPSDMTDGKTLSMVSGNKVTIRNVDGQLSVDGAKITKAIKTTNGMIYIIDSVPPSMVTMGFMSR